MRKLSNPHLCFPQRWHCKTSLHHGLIYRTRCEPVEVVSNANGPYGVSGRWIHVKAAAYWKVKLALSFESIFCIKRVDRMSHF